jgi:hypothetical protein
VFWKDCVVSIGTKEAKLNVGGEYEQSGEPDKFVAPPVPSLPHAKPDQPIKPPVNPDLADLAKKEEQARIEMLAKVAQLEHDRDVLREAFAAAAEAIVQLNRSIKALEARPAAGLQEYQLVAVRPGDKDQGVAVSTSKSYGHGHEIRVRLEKK